jgi:hypothetical protein
MNELGGEKLRPHPVGVLFEYFKNDAITMNNYESLVRMNPGVPVIPICTGLEDELMRGAVRAAECGLLGARWAEVAKNHHEAWRNCDLPYLAWYSSDKRRISCERWLLTEYDMYCSMRVLDYVAPTLHAKVVAPSITLPNREPGWEWFREISHMPSVLRPFANGVVPTAGVIIADEAMERICSYYLEHTVPSICELRLGTIANFLGYPPVPNSHPAARNITWRPHSQITVEPALWHPVKFIPGVPE